MPNPHSERQVQRAIELALGRRGDTVTYRQDVGKAWHGIVHRDFNDNGQHYVVLRDARMVEYGLCKGSSDLIGWHRQIVTPEMVGQPIARFLAIEVKRPEVRDEQGHVVQTPGRASPEQLAFVRGVRNAGGIAAIVRSVADLGGVMP